MSAAQSENFSETRRGGRPKLIGEGLRATIDFAVGNPNASERTRQNKLYQMRAMLALKLTTDESTPPEYLWIWGLPHVPRPGDHRVKWTILAELGRIEDDDELREVAAEVCRRKMKTREAVVRIRQYRNGGAKAGDSLELANVVIGAINDYMNRRPGLTPGDIRDALRTAEACIVE